MIRTILALLGFILQLFKRGGSRVSIETRSESSIDSERKRLEKLRNEVKRTKEQLDEVTIKIARAKSQGLNRYANSLEPARRLRLKQYADARDEYERAGGRWP